MEYVVSFLIGIFVGLLMRREDKSSGVNEIKIATIENNIIDINKNIDKMTNIIGLRKDDRRK